MIHLTRKGIPIKEKAGVIIEKDQSRDRAAGAGNPGEPTHDAIAKGIDV
jgi:hypothetical protein